jgi:hypothetical protein
LARNASSTLRHDDFISPDAQFPDTPFYIESHMRHGGLHGGKTVHSNAVDKSGWASINIPLKASMRNRVC